MANVFVYYNAAIATGAPTSLWTPNLSVSSWIIYQYKTTIYKQIQSESAAFFNMAVGRKLGWKPSLKLSFKPKSN